MPSQYGMLAECPHLQSDTISILRSSVVLDPCSCWSEKSPVMIRGPFGLRVIVAFGLLVQSGNILHSSPRNSLCEVSAAFLLGSFHRNVSAWVGHLSMISLIRAVDAPLGLIHGLAEGSKTSRSSL